MNNALLFDFTVDKDNNTIHVKREFAAGLQHVWDAWTKAEILDQWWAPKPFEAKTKSLDFRAGGSWLYAMTGPDAFEQFCRADYQSVDPLKSYTGLDAFCDSEGNINTEFPRSLWTVDFAEQANHTLVSIAIRYEKPEDLEKILSLGFKEGFTMGLGNLDEYFTSH